MTNEVIENQVINSGADKNTGLRLKKAREALNLSQKDVAKHLKSSEKIIDALEKEDFSKLPQPIYVSGYLKSYANLVSLSADEVIQSYPNLSRSDPVIPNFRTAVPGVKLDAGNANRNKGSNFKLVVILLLVVIIVVGAWMYFKNDGISGFVSEAMTKKMIVTEMASKSPGITTSQLVKQPKSVPLSGDEVIDTGSSRLLLEITMDSWIEVTDAKGKKLEYRMAKAPSRRIIQGEAPFKVFLGNAPGVTINYNGLPFDLKPYSDGDVAQFTVGKAEDNDKQVN